MTHYDDVLYDDAISDDFRRIGVVVSGGGYRKIYDALEEICAAYVADHDKLIIRVYPDLEARAWGGWVALATWRAGRGLLVDFKTPVEIAQRRDLHRVLSGSYVDRHMM